MALASHQPKPVSDVPGQLSDTESPNPAQYEINEKSFLRRLDLKLLPPLSLLYLMSFLDRSNVGNARIEGLTTDLHMTGNEYLTGLTLFFVGYVIFEVPANIVLKLWTPRLWLPTVTIVWGIVATLLGVVQNKSGFLGARFALELQNVDCFQYDKVLHDWHTLTLQGIVYYLSMWYKRNERQYRIALFFSAASLAGAFGGVLAWGIAHMNGVGNYRGWRWIFIIEGLATIVIGTAAYFFIHNYPDTASFLKPKERDFVQQRLKADSDNTNAESFAWPEVRKAFTDVKVYLYCLGFHTMSLPLYTLSLFLPSIIRDLGYTAAQAQLLTVPPYAFAFFTTLTLAILSEKTRRRAPFILGSSSFAIIGYILLLSSHRPGPSYTGVFFAAGGIYPSVALVLAWPANNVSGQTKRAVANAMQIMIGNLGAVLGTQLYRTQTAPKYILGHSFALGYLVANIVVISTLWLVLKRENSRRDKLQIANPSNQPGIDIENKGATATFKGDDDLNWRFYL